MGWLKRFFANKIRIICSTLIKLTWKRGNANFQSSRLLKQIWEVQQKITDIMGVCIYFGNNKNTSWWYLKQCLFINYIYLYFLPGPLDIMENPCNFLWCLSSTYTQVSKINLGCALVSWNIVYAIKYWIGGLKLVKLLRHMLGSILVLMEVWDLNI